MSVRFGRRVEARYHPLWAPLTFEMRDNGSWWLGGRAGGWVTLGASWMRQVTQRHPATSTHTQQPAPVFLTVDILAFGLCSV